MKNEDLTLMWIVVALLVLSMLFSMNGCATLKLTSDENDYLNKEKQRMEEEKQEPKYPLPNKKEVVR